MTTYTLVIFLDPFAANSCINTRNTNLISVIRDVRLNVKGQLTNIDILKNELQFLKNFYGVVKYRYTVLPDNIVSDYIENVDKLTEDELKGTKTINHKDGTIETVQFIKKLIECNKVNDGNESHEVYLIKYTSAKDMIEEFKKGCPDMSMYEYTETQPKEMKPKKKADDKETPHKDGKKVAKTDGKGKAATPAKGKAATAAKPKAAAPAKGGKKPATKKNEPEPDPEDAGEEDVADEDVAEEETADE